MAYNFYDDLNDRFREQSDQYQLGSIYKDPKFKLPEEVIEELNTRIPNPQTPTPEIPTPEPEIPVEGLPAPISEPAPIDPSSFDVNVSTTTPRMEGRPESLPMNIPSDPMEAPKRLWELEDDAAPIQETTPPVGDPTISSDLQDSKATEDAALLATADNDKAARETDLTALEKRRKLQIIPEFGAGVGDAISASASAFGGNAPGGSMQRMIERHDKQLTEGKADVEVKLRNNAGSDISKQYQNLLAQMMQKDPSDATIIGMTANQITEKIPAVEKMMQRRSDEELKRLTLEAAASKAKGQTTAQKAVDKAFGKDYAEYVAGGGYADTMTQIGTLEGVLADLTAKGGSNLTGGGLSMLPDAIRKRTFSDSMAAQQAVEMSVQRTLKKTLGGQFTEKEGILFMQRGYDPALDEAQNAEKLERAINQLKLMALAKQEAIDHYEENDTLDGFKGTFYTLKDGQMVEATKEDFLQMMQLSPTGTKVETTSEPRKTKSNYSYTVD